MLSPFHQHIITLYLFNTQLYRALLLSRKVIPILKADALNKLLA